MKMLIEINYTDFLTYLSDFFNSLCESELFEEGLD